MRTNLKRKEHQKKEQKRKHRNIATLSLQLRRYNKKNCIERQTKGWLSCSQLRFKKDSCKGAQERGKAREAKLLVTGVKRLLNIAGTLPENSGNSFEDPQFEKR